MNTSKFCIIMATFWLLSALLLLLSALLFAFINNASAFEADLIIANVWLVGFFVTLKLEGKEEKN